MTQTAEFFRRDRTMHPPALTPRYKTSVTRDGKTVYRFDIRLQGENETVFFDV